MRAPIGHVPIGKMSHELFSGLCADAETIRNRSLQLRRQAIDIVSDAWLRSPRNEIQLNPRQGYNQERPKRRATHPELTAIANREMLLVSDAHTEREQASLSDQAAGEIFSDVQTLHGHSTTNFLADSTAASKATAHDDSMSNVDVMYESSIKSLHTEADPFQRAAPSGLALTFCLPHFSRGHLGAPQPSPISIVILSLMLTWQIRLSNPHQSLCISNQSQPWGSHRVSHSVGKQLALWKENSNRWDSCTRYVFHL